MKSTNNRIYLDYNATAPLSDSVVEFLRKGQFLFANTSSPHQSGKSSKKELELCSNYILNFFNVKNDFEILYHSGASEAASIILKSYFLQSYIKKRKLLYVYSLSDHACSYNQVSFLNELSLDSFEIILNNDGLINFHETKSEIKKWLKSNPEGTVILSLTHVNSETGIVNSLSQIAEFKKINPKTFIHLDCVQSIGKIRDFNKLSKEIDFYTFSGHKFGALKGVGFSLIKKDLKLLKIIDGGNQQDFRAGTINLTGIISMKIALNDLHKKFNADELAKSKSIIEAGVSKILNKYKVGEIVSMNSSHRNLNTTCIVFYKEKVDFLFAKFDLCNIDIGLGSACSSNISSASKVLLAMGYDSDVAKNTIRISISPLTKVSEANQIKESIVGVLEGYFSKK